MRNNGFLSLASPMVAALILGSMTAEVRASFIQLTNGYFQDFKDLRAQGNASFTLPGWEIQQYGNDNDKIRADNGSRSSGGIYSYGPKHSPNRALGTLTDFSMGQDSFAIFGASFQNASAGPITSLNISYTGEEWRLGVAGHENTLEFQYSLNAHSVGDTRATWLNVPALNFVTPNTISVGAHDGTLAINQAQLSSSISFLNIAPGQTFWIRWQETGVANNSPGDGLAVDNFSISAVPEASTWGAALAAVGLLGALVWKRR